MNRHNIAGAIPEYEREILNGTDAYHTHHMLGVALSTRAESGRLLGLPAWDIQAEADLRRALHEFGIAATLAMDAPGVHLAAIQCDEGVATARLALATGDDRFVDRGKDIVSGAIGVLEGGAGHPLGDPVVLHQLAIAYGWLARLAWGRCLGFGEGMPVGHDIRFNFETARNLFLSEVTPDDERAWRSLLCAMALGCDAAKQSSPRREYARIAIKSARKHDDRKHLVRAIAIYSFGVRGERWLLRRTSR